MGWACTTASSEGRGDPVADDVCSAICAPRWTHDGERGPDDQDALDAGVGGHGRRRPCARRLRRRRRRRGRRSAPGPAAHHDHRRVAPSDTTVAPPSDTTADTDRRHSATDDTAADTDATTGVADGGPFGLIDDVYQGPNDFTVDPADCPEDWDPTQGITDTEIKLFISLPEGRPVRRLRARRRRHPELLQLRQRPGGIDGRKITLDVQRRRLPARQDQEQRRRSARAPTSTPRSSAVLGTANNLAVWDETNDECMPQLFNGSGAPHWGDIDNHPWTTGHADRLLHRGQAVGASGCRTTTPTPRPLPPLRSTTTSARATSTASTEAIEGTGLDGRRPGVPRADGSRT